MVVTPQPTRRLYTPTGGLVEATLRVVPDPSIMLAFWLIGFEEASPEDSGEICVVELFGDSIGTSLMNTSLISTGESELSIGVKAHHDPRLRTDMERVRIPLDATRWHRYAAAWDAEKIRFLVDHQLVRTVRQSITYPLQLMIDLFEFPRSPSRAASDYPKTGDVRRIRGYRPMPARP